MKNLWIAIAVVVVLGGGYWFWQSQQAPAMSDDGTPAATDAMDDMNGQPASTTPTSNTGGTTTGNAPMSATVTFNGDAFSPSTVTVANGGTVTFTDTSSNPFWVASNPHPVHTGYDGTSMSQHCASGYSGAAPFDECSAGTSYSFTFTKTGTWGYHDHLEAQLGGTVVVQ